MWRTTDGFRILKGAEADLLRHAAAEMVDCLQREFLSGDDARIYGVPWFDQWDVEQRIWLLDAVIGALLQSDQDPPPSAAIFEATVDAIFLHVMDEVELEMAATEQFDWRRSLLAAFLQQNGKASAVTEDEVETRAWRQLVGQICDSILGHPCYQQAEDFRDGEPELAERFLRQRGLPPDYLRRIPPLPGKESTLDAIESIKRVTDR